MKYIYASIIIWLMQSQVKSQNLVVNGSFEVEDMSFYECLFSIEYPDCLIGNIPPWISYNGTPDLFDTNGFSGPTGIPVNYWGNQETHLGSNYVGIRYTPLPSEHKIDEVIGAPLIEPLVVGQTYRVSFWVSFADISNCASNHIGLLFTNQVYHTDAPFYIDTMPFPNRAHIWTEDIITDKDNWTEIAGEFTADSAYTHFMIGRLLGNTQYISTATPNQLVVAYYYLDDICIVPLGGDCSIISPTSQAVQAKKVSIYPNPVSERLYLEGDFETATLYDMTGRVVLESQTHEVLVADLPKGLYLVRLKDKNGKVLKTEKINKL